MKTTAEPYYEDIYDALRSLVQVLGGAKVVGCRLWPDKSADHACTKLNNCLDRSRPEKLDPEQMMWLLREGRKAGIDTGMNYLTADCGYQAPKPLSPQDEKAALMREFTASVAELKGLMAKLGRFEE